METYEVRYRNAINTAINAIKELKALNLEQLALQQALPDNIVTAISFLDALDSALQGGGTLPAGGYTVLFKAARDQ